MLRVLIADDSTTARSLLHTMLASDAELQIVGEASNGLEAVEQTQRLRRYRHDGPAHAAPGWFGSDEGDHDHGPHADRDHHRQRKRFEVETSLAHAAPAPWRSCRSRPVPGSQGFTEATRELIATIKAMAQVKVVRHWRLKGRRRPRMSAAHGPTRRTVKSSPSLPVRAARRHCTSS